MKSLLSCSLILLCTTVFAQQKRDKKLVLPKMDTTKMSPLKDLKKEIPANIPTDQKEQYKILTVMPKDTSAYMALKEAKKDYSKYRILNTAAPEKTATDPKKATPSK
ncbi:hypothetical protein HHL23_07910 [Chryseobacterium sp. RP-3-3]|uniref:Uncharacterized protein n=1 Tax=Chryseobacterium antibioticum TaxID=2728847 RepID=A0A7Y0FR40_9FLAO|nr:hypothetical protein [Chryseobacterium antibioticum]NML69718.1 hypothetical protein [Chryseobacterium antibioticum]